MSKRRRSDDASLGRAFIAITNTLNTPAILDRVSAYSYDAEHMSSGMALHDSAKAALAARRLAAGAQSVAKKYMDRAEKKAFTAYQKLSEVAKAIYEREPERLAALGLNQAMPRSTDPFLAAAFRLFDNAGGKEALGAKYTAERLAAERAKIEAYRDAVAEHQHAMGAAQVATQHKDAAFDALDVWTVRYLRIARAVLKDQGQLAEKIGIKVRTRRTAAQRAAGRKAAATRTANRAAQEPEPEMVWVTSQFGSRLVRPGFSSKLRLAGAGQPRNRKARPGVRARPCFCFQRIPVRSHSVSRFLICHPCFCLL